MSGLGSGGVDVIELGEDSLGTLVMEARQLAVWGYVTQLIPGHYTKILGDVTDHTLDCAGLEGG